LGQHQVSEVGFADFGEDLFVGHGGFLFHWLDLRFMRLHVLRDPLKWIVKLPQSKIKSVFDCAECLVLGGCL